MALQVDDREFDRLRARIAQLSSVELDPLLERLGEKLAEQTRERLLVEKASPDGRRWKPRRERGDGHPLENKSGLLIRSIDFRVIPEGVEVGSPLRYAAAQMFGSAAQHIPARPYLGLGPDDAPELERTAAEYLVEAVS